MAGTGIDRAGAATDAPTSVTFTADRLRSVAERFFIAAGTPEDIAAIVSADLVDANLVGHDSHGLLRLPQYLDAIKLGTVVPTARPAIHREHGATALVSGEWGFGQVSGRFALDLAVQQAKTNGIGSVGLIRANHVGRLGAFMERAADAGCVAFMWVGGIGGQIQAVPFGGAKPVYGTNPLAAGIPAGDEGQVIVDFATTSVAGGKIRVALDEGKQLAPGTVVDASGNPTTDPAEFFKGGSMLPFGGHKGYALAVLVELIGVALTGSDQTGEELGGGVGFGRSGAVIIAMDIGAFRPAEDAETASQNIVSRIRATPPAPGFERVMTPGEPEFRTKAIRQESGLTLHRTTWQAILTAGERIGIASEETISLATGSN